MLGNVNRRIVQTAIRARYLREEHQDKGAIASVIKQTAGKTKHQTSIIIKNAATLIKLETKDNIK